MSNQSMLYEITTKMDKEDYKKFSYMTVYRNKTRTVLLIILLAAVGSGLAALVEDAFSVPKFMIIWAILIAVAFAAIFLRTEYKAMNWANQVKAGISGGKQMLTFFENHLIAEQENVKGSNKIKYENLYQAQETKEYFIIYAGANSASLIRKKDIDSEDLAGFGSFLQRKMGSRYKKV